jgi:hypothetical protein
MHMYIYEIRSTRRLSGSCKHYPIRRLGVEDNHVQSTPISDIFRIML